MRSIILAIAALALFPFSVTAQTVDVIGGATSVALDTATLSAAAGLNLSSVSPGIGGGVLPGSVAFPINPRDAATLPTTFAYTPGDFPGGPFSGTIEHSGSVFFNADSIEVGDFTIGFNSARATGANSGFFVASTTGVSAILFDTQVVSLGAANSTSFDLTVNLVVSPEFATFLGNTALTGADVGDARIVAAVPEPTALGSALVGFAMIGGLRRR